MKTSHTPGPWRTNGQTVTARGPWQNPVAICPSKADPRPLPDAAAKTHEEAQANARLIAAAPELLEALCAATDEIERLRGVLLPMYDGKIAEPDADILANGRTAITKATTPDTKEVRA